MCVLTDEPAAALDLEKELSDVIDEDQGLLLVNVRLSDIELDDEGHWLVCVECGARHLVPHGQSCTLQK